MSLCISLCMRALTGRMSSKHAVVRARWFNMLSDDGSRWRAYQDAARCCPCNRCFNMLQQMLQHAVPMQHPPPTCVYETYMSACQLHVWIVRKPPYAQAAACSSYACSSYACMSDGIKGCVYVCEMLVAPCICVRLVYGCGLYMGWACIWVRLVSAQPCSMLHPYLCGWYGGGGARG